MYCQLCEGDACEAVTVKWSSSAAGYIVFNRSDRCVRVSLQTCTNLIEVTVAPQESVFLAIVQFEMPFQARFE